MFKIFRLIHRSISSIYWNYKINQNFYINGFRISKVDTINNPSQIRLGKNVNISSGSKINCQSKNNGFSLTIGDFCKIGKDVQINAYENVEIKKNVLISDRVHISDASHNYKMDKPVLNQGSKFFGPVIIEEGAWIGINAVILPNVKIGKNSVVAANCVVNKDVPNNSIAVGVPAKIISK
tara:strand:- start:493 stop:1032 length:540 start_codon:yes stop_codon:yes gene_type:complete